MFAYVSYKVVLGAGTRSDETYATNRGQIVRLLDAIILNSCDQVVMPKRSNCTLGDILPAWLFGWAGDLWIACIEC